MDHHVRSYDNLSMVEGAPKEQARSNTIGKFANSLT